MADQTPDFSVITARQQQTWATGDFNVLARSIMTVSDHLVATVDPHPGQHVLDVACGSGNGALSAARRYAVVSGLDYVPALIEHAKARAAADGSSIDFRVGDAQALPFADASFDVVLSVFGVMFAPDQDKTAKELWRVCKPGGRIALANWTPDGFGGVVFKTMGPYNPPPPPGLKPPVRWGTEAGLRELFGAAAKMRITPTAITQYFPSVDEMVDIFVTWFGPAARAFASQDAAGKAALKKDMAACFTKYNRATDGTAGIAADYVEVVIER